MSKRAGEPLDGEDDTKRLCIEEEEEQVLEEVEEDDGTTHTVIIQEGDVLDESQLTMTTILQEDGTEITVPLHELQQHHIETDDGEEGHGGLHIVREDGTVIISEGQVMTEEIIQEHSIEGEVEHVATLGEDAQLENVSLTTVQEGDAVLTEVEELEVEDADLNAAQYQNIIIQHMDIEEPLTTLRKLLEARLQCSLHDHEFYLQDSLQLDPTKNLVSQCVQGTGMVQINVEVKSQPDVFSGMKPRLNIVDILKPAEEVDVQPTPTPPPQQPQQTKVVIPFPEESENVTRWIVDQNFRKEQERLKIPFDPMLWNEAHVKHWIQWAVKNFSLEGVDIPSFRMNGQQLCALKHEDFIKFIPNDKGDIFWTHLELLRKCKFVAVIQQPTPHAITTITVSTSNQELDGRLPKTFSRTPKARMIMLPSDRSSPGNRTGNNGQIQLWQFLLELLTDKDCREVIQWVGDEGEFKLNNPEMVAQLWGQRKNKPTMNYEKLSRALRYYYDGDMIAKVHGKRFVYKFVCDLRMLLGYTAGELNGLVTESAEKKLQKVRESLRPGITKRIIEIPLEKKA